MPDYLEIVQQYVNREQLERTLLVLYARFDRWFSTISIDESTKSSIYIGLTIGICVVTFLVFFPGEPTSDYETSTEEEALNAVKRKLYKKKELDGEESKGGSNTLDAGGGNDEQKKRAMGDAENVAPGSSKPKKTGKKKGAESVDDETLRRMEKFAEIKDERIKEMDEEAEMFLEDMKTKGVTEERLREMVPEYLSVSELKENSKKPWIVTLINWSIPLALVYAIFWVLQRDFGVTPLAVFRHFLPRETAVFTSISDGLLGGQ